MTEINLNADLGESIGETIIGDDQAMLAIVSSANVACGFHGGDPLVMVRTVDEAARNGVSIGAHPSFPDLEGFGRRRMTLPPDELKALILYQLAALDGVARARGERMSHVKPHGALNNMAAENAELAGLVAGAVRDYDRNLIFLAPALSELSKAGRRLGLRVAEEIFADRAYAENGSLIPRGQEGAMIEGAEA
ncbi:MAG: LamB/YcsF family protein, partial [Rhodospirillales bacterium]|nr:LamB/YcsF family protein [Rhodospirillales bacterium]